MDIKIIPHPSCFIDSKLTETIRRFAADAEKSGSLHREQLSIIYEQKQFNLFVPKIYNGLQLSLPEALQIEECLAWADGSTGWTVTLCSGANWFIGFLKPALAKLIFNEEKVCLAGSGRSSGTASIIEGGYEISGYWSYATGAAHATAFTANCVIEKNGIIMQNKDGSPMVQSFLFLRKEVIIHEDWDCMGMIATSSHSFEVKKLRVHEDRSFVIDNNHAEINHPLFQYPFLQFAEATLAINSSGMAIRFMDLCETIFTEKKSNTINQEEIISIRNQHLEAAINDMKEIRQSFYSVIQHSWNECLRANTISMERLKEISEASKKLAAKSRNIVDTLYPYCGLIAAKKDSEINRVWRNLHTASLHPLLLY